MLVLTRRPGQTIRIGDDIEITVIDVRERQIRLGIAAPRQISVDRQEVALRKQAERDHPSAGRAER